MHQAIVLCHLEGYRLIYSLLERAKSALRLRDVLVWSGKSHLWLSVIVGVGGDFSIT